MSCWVVWLYPDCFSWLACGGFNLFNFMDGIDGIAGLQAVFMLLTGAALSAWGNHDAMASPL